MSKPIGTLGTIDTLEVGGRVFTDLANLIQLNAAFGVGGPFSGFFLGNGTPYQVSAGKTFTGWAAQMTTQLAGSPSQDYPISFGYSVNLIGAQNASAPASPLYFPFGNGTPLGYAVFSVANGGNVQFQTNLNFIVPAGSYPFCGAVQGGEYISMVNLYGYEM